MTAQQLHDLINEKIYENHVGAITATDMNTILNEMVSEEEQIEDTYMPLSGGTFVGPVVHTDVTDFFNDVDMKNNYIVNVKTPVNPTDAANKQYVDNALTWIE